jgi:TolA-binding protein
MLFDDGMSSDALACFKEYLRLGGELAAEAMLGKALALQQLGQTEEERAAWTALLEAYPESPHAERARLRLAILRDPW